MSDETQKVDVLAVMNRDAFAAAIERQWDDDAPERAEESAEARAAVAELMERDRIATEVFTCILRGMNDLNGSMSYGSETFVSGWLQQWATSMYAAGFKPINPEARDISAALARIEGAK